MSELTTCNYCRLESIRRDAKKKGFRVVVVPVDPMKDEYKLAGNDVYIIKKKGQRKPERADWACWFMQITNVCCC